MSINSPRPDQPPHEEPPGDEEAASENLQLEESPGGEESGPLVRFRHEYRQAKALERIVEAFDADPDPPDDEDGPMESVIAASKRQKKQAKAAFEEAVNQIKRPYDPSE